MPPPYFDQEWLRMHNFTSYITEASRCVASVFDQHQIGAENDQVEKLYHYTSLSGLRGILEPNEKGENVIWATDFNYLNDWSEPSYQLTVISEAIAAADHTKIPFVDAEGRTGPYPNSSGVFLDKIRSESSWVSGRQERYVACFCGNEDALGQWRGYGNNGGGYCLIFQAEENSGSFPLNDSSTILRKIVYEKNKQIAIVLEILKRFADLSNRIDLCVASKFLPARPILEADAINTALGSIQHHFISAMQFAMKQALCFFKHPSFAQEEEVRLIASRNHNAIDFYEKGGILVPYQQIPLSLTCGGWKGAYKLVEVQFGPGLDSSLTKNSLKLWLSKLNYSGVKVDQSQIPFRTGYSSSAPV